MTRYERELRNTLTDLGYGVMRAPSSGAGGDHDLPDLLFGEPMPGYEDNSQPHCHAVAVEHKSTGKDIARVQEDEVAALRRFCESFGAAAMLGVRWTSQGTPTTHYLIRPDEVRRTPGGNYAIDRDGCEDIAAMTFKP